MVILEVVTMLTKDEIKFIVPLKKGKDDIIPCLYERSFSFLFDQDLDNLGLLLKDILDLDEKDLKGNIIKLSNNLDINHKKDKYRKMDFVYRIKNKKIDIELNLDPKTTKERNLNYLMGMHLKNYEKGDRFEKGYKTIQLNFNKENVTDSKEIIERKAICDIKTGAIYSDNSMVLIINLCNLKKLCYNDNKKLKELQKYKKLLLFIFNKKSEIEKYCKEDPDIMSMLDKLNEFSSDNQEWITFRDDNELEIERKMGMERVLKEAEEKHQKEMAEIKKEADEKIKENQKKIIENMLTNNMDLEIICKITGLSLEEVNSLKG